MLSVENADSPAETGELLRQRRRHGMRDPELAVDGAMSLWRALAAVFPAEHWVHLRTTNPVESTFSTTRLRTQATRGAGSPVAAQAMVVKLVEAAQARWRAITGAHLVLLVRAGTRFENGILVEGPQAVAA